MTDAERDAWAGEVLERIRRHRRRMPSGVFSMMDEGLLDVLDALAVAPLLTAEMEHDADDYERRRLEKLERYQPDWRRIRKDLRNERYEHSPSARCVPGQSKSRHGL